MTQNKVLPGAYINFVSRPRAMGSLGERGVVCVGMELDWGREGRGQNELQRAFRLHLPERGNEGSA